MTRLSPFITGTKDRARRNEQTMTVTLDRLAAYTQKPLTRTSHKPCRGSRNGNGAIFQFHAGFAPTVAAFLAA